MRLSIYILFAAAMLVWGDDTAVQTNSPRPNPTLARSNFEAGERAARNGDSLLAYRYYARAADLDPANRVYRDRKQAFEKSAALAGAIEKTKPDPAIETVEASLVESGAMQESKPAMEPPQLAPKPGRQTFHLRGDAVTLWTMVADGFGLKVVFDRAYQPLPNLRLNLENVEMADAFRVLQAASDSFAVPASENSIVVGRDTAEKRNELIPMVAMAVPIPERLTVQEAQEILTAIQQSMEIRRISLDAAKRVVYFRDAYSKAIAARQIFEQLSQPRAQVEVEVEFLEVSKTSNLSYGFLPPTGAPVIDFGVLPASLQIPTLPTAVDFATLGGGASLIGLGITDSTLFATVANSSAKTLLSSTVMAMDGQPSSLHVGDRYPVITSNFSGVSGGAAQNPGLSSGIQFVDLGLVLKLTPTVHAGGEVTLDVSAAFKTLGASGANTNGIPAIGNREYQGKVRLKTGEWAVIAGLITQADLPTVTGVAGIAQIPLLGSLFSQKTHEVDSTETLVVLKPRLLNLPPWETDSKPLWTGTESRPASIF